MRFRSQIMGQSRFLARWLYPSGAVRRVLRGPVRGMRFVVEPGIGVSYAMGRGAYNFDFLRARCRPGMTVYDIGANRGQMVLFFARLAGPQGHVYCFEPVPALVQSLRTNLQLNRLETVSVCPVAVAEQVGTTKFLFSQQRPTTGRLSDVARPDAKRILTERLEVKTTTLDRLIAEGAPAPDLIKIDVEGGLASVLAGARDLLEQARPGIYVELHSPEELMAVRHHLLDRGYVAETLSGVGVVEPERSREAALWLHTSFN